MRTEYPAKVLLAWGEALNGNGPLRNWLMANGYPELGLFTFALRIEHDARRWLMENGHAHLMALVRAVEGEEAALQWLERNGFDILRQMALTANNDPEAFDHLLRQGHRELALIAKRIGAVRRAIEEDHKDPHKFSRH
jgi:hypothetical protein